jgi:molybdopterin/thiamine biosynthesis adenylyltransferase
MNYSLTLQERHYTQLKNHLIRSDGKERAAFIVCGRSLVENFEDRFLSRELFLLEDNMLLSSETYEVSWDNKYFIHLLKKVESKGFAIILIHNHPTGINYFSKVDDEGEYHLFKLAFNRNGGFRPYGSLIMLTDGSLIGRAWKHDLTYINFSKIRVIGQRFKIWYNTESNKNYITPQAFHRQQLAFGSALIQDLQNLTICVVGAGATGSATVNLLSRLGIGEIIIIDNDEIEESNLNRLWGATSSDIGKSKVNVLKKHIDDFGLNSKVIVENNWVSDRKSIEGLKKADLIFNCTDDHAGRILLNRFAYFYLIPVIDMGLVISVKNDPPEIQDLQGRVSYLYPGTDCLLTKRIINPDIAYAENLQREDPLQYKKLKEEAYVIGEKNPSPAVITFTTMIASIAVNDFLNRIIGFNPTGYITHRLYLFHRNTELNLENGTDKECQICGKENSWGRGDMLPFLDMVI